MQREGGRCAGGGAWQAVAVGGRRGSVVQNAGVCPVQTGKNVAQWQQCSKPKLNEPQICRNPTCSAGEKACRERQVCVCSAGSGKAWQAGRQAGGVRAKATKLQTREQVGRVGGREGRGGRVG